MEDVLKIALNELGVKEIPGQAENPIILDYASQAGFDWVKTEKTAWCSIFMNWVALKAGYKRTNSALARSWLKAGVPIDKPEPGDIVVYWREKRNSYKGHVGIFMGFSIDGNRIYTLGGNQSDAVSISAYSKDQLLGFRRLIKASKIKLSTRKLKRGDRGEDVIRLQDALKMAFIDVGTSDGIYGPKTQNGVKLLQTMNEGLKITGIFDKKTRLFLLDTINT